MSIPPSPPSSSLSGSSAPIPDVCSPPSDILLSAAKDGRYVSELTSLLSQVIAPWTSVFLWPTHQRRVDPANRNRRDGSDGALVNDSEPTTEEAGKTFVERIRPELDLLASLIVHSATFIFYTRNFGSGTRRHDQSVQRSLGMESLHLAYLYPAKAPISTTLRKTNRRPSIRDYLMRIIPRWKIDKWRGLLFIQTVVPYILHRVGRGGWLKDFSGLRRGLGSTVARTRTDHGQTREGGSEALQNNDRLRGSERRQLFDEQRRRMLASVNENSQASDSVRLGGDSVARPATRENITDTIERDSSPFALGSLVNTSTERRLRNLSEVGWKTLERISLAVSSLSRGPHTLHNNTGTSERLDRYARIIKWFLRLHLALFYWNGTYPTIAHRLAGAKIRDNVAPHSHLPFSPMMGAIVANRPNYKPIAVLIVLQALSALGQATAEALIEVAHSFQIRFFRWRQRRRMQRQGLGDSSLLSTTNLGRAEYIDLIEERVPSKATLLSRDAIQSIAASRSKEQRQPKTEIQQCGICLNPRTNPAAPSACGHVFCWNCVLHWVSNVRAECPICRADTLPQDILPLCNYA